MITVFCSHCGLFREAAAKANSILQPFFFFFFFFCAAQPNRSRILRTAQTNQQQRQTLNPTKRSLKINKLNLHSNVMSMSTTQLASLPPPPSVDLMPSETRVRRVSADVYAVESRLPLLGGSVPVRCSIVRLTDGSLIVFSPLALADALLRSLAGGSRVRAVIAPSSGTIYIFYH